MLSQQLTEYLRDPKNYRAGKQAYTGGPATFYVKEFVLYADPITPPDVQLAAYPEVEALWLRVKIKLGLLDHGLLRCYANLSHGSSTELGWHRDVRSFEQGCTTAMFYVSEQGSNTRFTDHELEFAPGKLVLFDSSRLHTALPYAGDIPRVVLVFKSRKQTDDILFMKRYGWHTLAHGKHWKFDEHLRATAFELAGQPDHVVKAGLYHAAYGTQYFKPLASPTREQLRAHIGMAAELLVYRFCTEDRCSIVDPELAAIAAANAKAINTDYLNNGQDHDTKH